MNQPYPAWLGRMLMQRPISFGTAHRTTMQCFLDSYTLHDSYWVGLWSEPSTHECIAIFVWDTLWSNGRLPHAYATGTERPLLLIHFSDVYHIFFGSQPRNSYLSLIGHAHTARVSAERRLGMLDSLVQHWQLPDTTSGYVLHDCLCQTHVESIGGDDVDLLHGEEVHIACFTAAGEPLAIPLVNDETN